MKKLALVLCLLSLAAPLRAQQGQAGFGELQFTSPLRLAVGTDNNFLVPFSAEPRPRSVDDRVFMVSLPTVSFLSDSRRRLFAVNYQPEFEIFFRNHDQNSWSNKADASFAYAITRRTQIYVADEYQSSKDPSRSLQNVFLLLPRSQFRQNQFGTSLEYEHSPVTTFSLRFHNSILSFGQTEPFQTRALDSTTTGGSFTVTRMLRPNHRLRGMFSVFKATFFNRQAMADEQVDQEPPEVSYPVQTANLEYRFTINRKTVLEFSGGLAHRSNGSSYVFGAFADRRFGEVWVGGGYSRTIGLYTSPGAAFASTLSATSVFDVARVTVRGQPARRVGLQVGVTASQGTAGPVAKDSRALIATARVDYRLNDRLVAFLSNETYLQNRNEFLDAPLSRNRFFVGIEFSLSGDVERRTGRLNRDAQHVALTEHGRQQVEPR